MAPPPTPAPSPCPAHRPYPHLLLQTFTFLDWKKVRSGYRYIHHFKTMFKSRIVRSVVPPALVVVVHTALVAFYTLAHAAQYLPWWAPALPQIAIEPFQLTSFALSLLLVFRTNTSYSRWYEGRRRFGAIITHSRQASCNPPRWHRGGRGDGRGSAASPPSFLQCCLTAATHAWTFPSAIFECFCCCLQIGTLFKVTSPAFVAMERFISSHAAPAASLTLHLGFSRFANAMCHSSSGFDVTCPCFPGRDFARQALAWFGHDDMLNKQLMARWLLAYSRTALCQLREDADLRTEVTGLLSPQEVQQLMASNHKPTFCLQVTRRS